MKIASTRTAATIATLGLMLAANVAGARENYSKWYATAQVGLGSLSSSSLSYSDGISSETTSANFEESFAGGGTLGYRIGNGWSVEGEIQYRRNDLEAVDVPTLGSFSGGDFASLGIAVNALYNFDIGESGKLSGYVGPGFVYFEEIDIDFDQAGEQELSFETDDTAFQIKFGGRYQFSDRWFMDAGATWLTADSVRLELPADSAQTISSDYDHWTLRIGAGLRF